MGKACTVSDIKFTVLPLAIVYFVSEEHFTMNVLHYTMTYRDSHITVPSSTIYLEVQLNITLFIKYSSYHNI